jgi:hypothetical protein
MMRCSPPAASDGSELRAAQERLHAVTGGTLADGQTPCCYVLTGGHPLLRALLALLALLDVLAKKRTGGARSQSIIVESPRHVQQMRRS